MARGTALTRPRPDRNIGACAAQRRCRKCSAAIKCIVPPQWAYYSDCWCRISGWQGPVQSWENLQIVGLSVRLGYTCTLASFWHWAWHVFMSRWPPKLKLRRTEEASFGIGSSRDCECFFTLTIAPCHVSEAPQDPPVKHRGHKLSPCEAHDGSVQHSLCLSKCLLPSYSSLCVSQNLLLTQAFMSVVVEELGIPCLFGSLVVCYEIALLLLLK